MRSTSPRTSSNGATRATIHEVARRAEVSATTVSHVLSGNRPVAEATRQRVQRVIEELGFRPSRLATGLRLRQSHTIALLVPDITNPFYPELARGAQDALIDAGYQTFICNTDSRPEQERELLQSAIARQVDGLLFAAFASGPAEMRSALEAGIATVLIGDGTAPARVDRVHSDDRRAGADVGRYLLSLGHRRLAFIAAPGGVRPSDARLEGYRAAINDRGPGHELTIAHAEFTREGGATALTRLLDTGTRPTAVFCANDVMAIGALDAARQHDLRVPGDLSIVGFDDIEAAAFITPALSTVHNPPYEHGQVAAGLLLQRITGTYAGRARERTIAHQIIERASTKPPRT
jgi:LacI family transcriptional regulator